MHQKKKKKTSVLLFAIFKILEPGPGIFAFLETNCMSHIRGYREAQQLCIL